MIQPQAPKRKNILKENLLKTRHTILYRLSNHLRYTKLLEKLFVNIEKR